jgi:hypothetical protein
MSFFVPDPRYMDFVRWASVLNEELSQYNLAIPTSVDDWKSWAMRLVSTPDLSADAYPDPSSYEDWRDWAAQVALLSSG